MRMMIVKVCVMLHGDVMMARVEQLEGVKQYLDNRPTRIGIGVEPKSVPRN